MPETTLRLDGANRESINRNVSGKQFPLLLQRFSVRRKDCKNLSQGEEKCIFVLLQLKRFQPQQPKGR